MGLAPATLSTLQTLASAVGNDPSFSSNLAATTTALQVAVDSKADAFTVSSPLLWNLDPATNPLANNELTVDSYTRAETDSKLAPKAEASLVNASLNLKAPSGKPSLHRNSYCHQRGDGQLGQCG